LNEACFFISFLSDGGESNFLERLEILLFTLPTLLVGATIVGVAGAEE